MTSDQITEALNRRPVFGDAAQIAALKALHPVVTDTFNEEGNRKYEVTVEFTLEKTVTVWAESEEEAEELAKAAIDFDDGDYCFDVQEI